MIPNDAVVDTAAMLDSLSVCISMVADGSTDLVTAMVVVISMILVVAMLLVVAKVVYIAVVAADTDENCRGSVWFCNRCKFNG